jgi:DNA-binding MarR family transcriptional regulator
MFEMGRLLRHEIVSDGGDMCSYLHSETLRFIDERGTPSMRDIAEYLKITPPSVTAQVTALVEDGVLERIADTADRRIIRLRLSKKGKSILQENMHLRSKAFSKIIAHLSKKDTQELTRILSVITRSSV